MGGGDGGAWARLADEIGRRRLEAGRRGAWRAWRPAEAGDGGQAAAKAPEWRSTRTAALGESVAKAWTPAAKKAAERLDRLAEAARAAWDPWLADRLRVRRYADGWVTLAVSNQALLSEASQFGADRLADSLRGELARRGLEYPVRGLRFAAAPARRTKNLPPRA